jgi:hypothetical protein
MKTPTKRSFKMAEPWMVIALLAILAPLLSAEPAQNFDAFRKVLVSPSYPKMLTARKSARRFDLAAVYGDGLRSKTCDRDLRAGGDWIPDGRAPVSVGCEK